MSEEIKLRDNFDGIDPMEVEYIPYELVDGLPDFSTYTIGSEQSIVLRNKITGGLERINFQVKSDTGEWWPQSRKIWGPIHARDMKTKYCCLCFYLNFHQDGVDDIAASFTSPDPGEDYWKKWQWLVDKYYPGACAAIQMSVDAFHPLWKKHFGPFDE